MEPNTRGAVHAYIKQLQTNTNLQPISYYKSSSLLKYNLFPQPTTLPQFFHHNLQSESRIIKVLKGEQAPFRAFYYQLLKLGFEIQCPMKDYSFLIKSILLNPRLCGIPKNNYKQSIEQYQRIIADWISNIEGQVIPNTELTLTQFPAIDEAMLVVLERVLQVGFNDSNKGFPEINSLVELFERLCGIFEITLEVYENCFSFEESDMFLYVESMEVYYLAFLSEMAQIQSYDRTSESPMDIMECEGKEQFVNNVYGERQNDIDEQELYKNIRLSAGNKTTRTMVTIGNRDQNRRVGDLAPKYEQTDKNKEESGESQILQKNVFDSSVFIQNGSSSKKENVCNLPESQISINRITKNPPKQQYHNYQNLTKSDNITTKTDLCLDSLTKQQPKQQKVVPKVTQPISYSTETSFPIQQTLNKTEDENIACIYPQQQKSTSISDHLIIPTRFNSILDSVGTYQSISDSSHQVQESIKSGEKHQKKQSIDKMSIFNPKSQTKPNNEVYSYQFKTYKQEFWSNGKDLKSVKDDGKSGFYNEQKYEQKYKNVMSLPNSYSYQQNSAVKIDLYNPTITIQNVKQIKQEPPIFLPNNQSFTPKYFPYIPYVPIAKHTPYTPFSSYQYSPTLKKEFPKKINQAQGTFYREFSDTKVMEAMIEPCRSKVRATRQKFKGIRSGDFRGFV